MRDYSLQLCKELAIVTNLEKSDIPSPRTVTYLGIGLDFSFFEGFPSEKEDRRSPEPDLIFFTLRSRLQPLFDYTFLDTGHSGVCWCRGGAEG